MQYGPIQCYIILYYWIITDALLCKQHYNVVWGETFYLLYILLETMFHISFKR